MLKHPLPGSERQPLRGAHAAGKAEPTELCQVSVVLNHNNADTLRAAVDAVAAGRPGQPWLAREDFARRFAASADDIALVRMFAKAHGLRVLRVEPERRTVVLRGSVAACNAAFDVDLQRFEHPLGSYRGHAGPLHLPTPLCGVVQAVLGLDTRPAARSYLRHRPAAADGDSGAEAAFSPVALAGLYGFPPGDGKGECVGIIELGGGYTMADLVPYFATLAIDPMPKVIAIPLDGGQNQPTRDANGPDGEVLLDIEVLGAVAPAAKLAVYFAPNTDAGFLAAVNAAVHDRVNRPSIISISWGGPEAAWAPQTMAAFDATFQAAAAMGITVCVASGDSGATDGESDGADHADFPASSPHVLACGGTSLRTARGMIASETTWNDTAQGGGSSGGGISGTFPLPSWQEGLSAEKAGEKESLSMRGVPDVCGNADPATGYAVRIDGADTIIGGTSAVAPLWAGLLARINAARRQPIGFVNPLLYAAPSALRDVTQGDNGDYAATPGWDACTGLGSPNGAALMTLLGPAPAAAAPSGPTGRRR